MTLPAASRLYALVPAAGSGTRMAASLPKQYLSLRGRTVAEHTLTRLLAYAPIDSIVVATAANDLWWPQLGIAHHPRIRSAVGGASRAESVCNGLQTLLQEARQQDWVLVHDMARPCVRLSDIDALVQGCGAEGAVLAAALVDTIKQARHGQIECTLPRTALWRALTPQLFTIGALHEALQAALLVGTDITDEASAMEAQGVQPKLICGHSDNIKITVPADLALAGFYLDRQQQEAP